VAAVVTGFLTVPVVIVALGASPAAALSYPAGFSQVQIPTGLAGLDLTNFVFLPGTNGLMLATGKCGSIRRVDQQGANTAVSWTPHDAVNCDHDRGLLGFDLAPDFATSKRVWTLYNYLGSDGKHYGRLSRWTVDSVTLPTSLSGEVIVLDGLPSFSATVPEPPADDSHTIGTVLAAPDGTLYVGNGDSSSYGQVDPSALNAQDVTSPRGKIFHINADGSGVSTNPFFQTANPNSWQSRVFAYGFRNPFRFTLKPGTSTLYVGDVGWNDFEEIDVARGGENFGWPCWEGQLSFRNGYSALSQCTALYNSPPSNLKAPLFSWPHFSANGDASVGGAFYTASTYPADYQGAYFFGDYAGSRMWTVRTDGNDATVRAPEANGFANGVGGPVAFRPGLNGDMYYADIISSNIYRIRYAPGNRAPTAVVSADKMAGTPPLTVNFDGTGSFDLDNEPVSYAWSFGDGGTSTAAKPSHTYTTAGTFTARLTVTDQLGATGTASVTINTTNNAPVLTVTGPVAGATYSVGDQVNLTATATDPEDGPLNPVSAITFQSIIHHCPTPGNCHLHPGAITPAPPTGTPYVVTVPDHGDDSFLEIVVTATDSQGATSTKSITLPAEEHVLNVASSPAGVSIKINGTDSATNPSPKEVANSVNQLIAPTPSGNRVFQSWSGLPAGATITPGAPNQVQFTMPHSDVSIVANYDTAPVATAAATPTSGAAPLAVQFSSTGSSDPDPGDTIAYSWNFGDGSAAAAGPSPTHTYTADGSYTATLTVTDNHGAPATATVVVNVGKITIPPPGTGWQINGNATVSGSSLVLTTPVANQVGSAFWPTPVPSGSLSVSFDATIDQGSGNADGMALVLANAASASPTALGAPGGGLGFSGIPGVAITLDTYKNPTDPSANFIGVATGGSGDALTYAATATTGVPTLAGGTHHVDVAVASGTITVKIDGTQVLSPAVALPANVLVGFSGSTGGSTNRHMVTNVVATTGPASPQAVLAVSPTALSFGTVAAGASSAKTFTIANTGTAALTVNSVGSPPAPFTMTGAPAANASLGAGTAVTVTVTLAPTVAGTWSGSIPIATSAGAATVALSGSTPSPGGGTTIPPPGTGWQVNGNATVSGSSLVLTTPVANQVGSAFWPTAVATANLHATFDITIGQGTGADGAAFVIGNVAGGARPTSLGVVGGGLGFSGIPGVAVTFDTYKNGSDPSANFIGVATGGSGDVLAYATTATTGVPALRSTTHHVDVLVSSGHLRVSIDGTQVIDSTVALPASAYLGFSGSTGGLTDRHAVSNVIITV
jgi:glucose/arabinose dehydrogenase